MANYGQPPGGYGAPPPGQGFPAQGQGYPGGQPGQGQYGAPPGQQAYGGAPGAQPGYGGAPGYGTPRPGQPAGYGAPPQGQYGAPAPGGYGAAPPPGQPGFGGAPPPGQYPGAPPQQGGWGAAPGVDPQVQQWFMSVDTDKSGRITAHELRQALVNTNWTHFNPETCRLMIGMFDRDMSGTIELQEFNALWNYINQWKAVFERCDQNKTGQIEANELQSALGSMGYNLSPQFIQLVISKFDLHGRRCLTLDNFIQACVMIKTNTDMFKQRDPSMTGAVKFSYEDFMTMTILNKP